MNGVDIRRLVSGRFASVDPLHVLALVREAERVERRP